MLYIVKLNIFYFLVKIYFYIHIYFKSIVECALYVDLPPAYMYILVIEIRTNIINSFDVAACR